MSKCKPKYKNLNLIQSFSDQRYAVLELFEQACRNEEWLHQQVEKLKYLSPPAMRNRFVYPDNIDYKNSYGWESSVTNEHEIVMSNSTHKTVEIKDFNDTNPLIDFNNSNCSYESYTGSDGVEKERAVCSPKIANVEKDVSNSFKNANGVNSFWYVGYDKSKPYVVNKKWVNNWKHPNIPSVVRAQTFKCTLTEINVNHPEVTEAWLKSVTLNIQNTGEMNHGWTSPLYVQIWPAAETFVPKTKWDKNKKIAVMNWILFSGLKAKAQASATEIAKGQYQEKYANFDRYSSYQKQLRYTSGKKKGQLKKDKNGNILTETRYKKDKNGAYVVEREIIWRPKNVTNGHSTIYYPLAEGKFNPTKTTPNWYTIALDKTCKLKKGEHYAIVMFSPLSHPSHCPRIGGYGRNCQQAKYNYGDAFLSEDNGRTFKRYGYNDLDLSPEEYKFGRLTPQDFTFELELNYSPEGKYEINNDSYLYLTPILSNPIKNFKVTGDVTGETEHDRANGLTAKIQYSVEGGKDNWYDIGLNETKYFDQNDLPQCLHLRVLLNTTKSNDTACIESLTVDMETDVAKQMYVRTSLCSPPNSLILGPHIWGRVFAPFEVTPNNQNINASVEIIENRLITEHIDIIDVSDLDNYIGLTDINGEVILDQSMIIGIDDDGRAQYLLDNPSILKRFKENMPNKSVYVKPYILNDVEHYMSFEGLEGENKIYNGSIQLKSSPAYPILESNFVPESNSAPFALGEWYDYTIDYDNDILILDESTLDDLPTGSIQLNYNPIFIQGLVNDEVGIRVDDETGLIEEGLILDYFKQSFIVNDSDVENRSIVLKAIPLSPLREVILNKDTDNERELYEDIDYSVDYENKKIIFPIKEDSTQASILHVNDTVDVVYTPELRVEGIMIGYWVKRNSSDYNVRIKPSYIEYK